MLLLLPLLLSSTRWYREENSGENAPFKGLVASEGNPATSLESPKNGRAALNC